MKTKILFAVMLSIMCCVNLNAQINTFPYFYDFENETTGGTGCNPTYSMGEAGWLNAAGDDMDWTNDVNTTGSGYGAAEDHTVAPGTFYMYLEASCAANRTANLETPIFDFTNAATPNVSFWYHMYGSTIDSLFFEVDTTGLGNWNTLWVRFGQQHTSTTDPWSQASISLSAYVGHNNVKFRFRGTTSTSGYFGDIAIDDFLVENILNNDAGVLSIDNPVNPITVGINPVEVTIKNYGFDTLLTSNIEWSVNGVPQTTFGWTGSLAKDSITGPVPVTIGTYNFQAGLSTIKAWTALPNAIVDSSNGNDTTEVILCTALKGIYTLGGVSADFNTFNDFANIITNCGVDSHVVVNVNPGIYNERLILTTIPGTSSSATVTINGGDTSLVTISNSTYSNVYLNGADWVTIKNMKLLNTSTTVDAYGVQLRDSAMNNTIDSCLIVMNVGTSGDVVGVSASDLETSSASEGANAFWTTVSNCKIYGGYYSIRFEGASLARNIGNQFINNVLDNPYYYGLYIDDQDSISIIGNTITNITNAAGDGIYCTDLMMFDISYNVAIDVPDWGLYIADGNFDAIPTSRGKIINNMISSVSDYGVYIDDIEETDIWHNTVYNTSGISGAFRINDMVNVDIRNNIFVSETDFAFESDDDISTGGNVIDYNNYWTPPSNTSFVDDGTTTYPDLTTWQSAQLSANIRSIEFEPLFVSPNDLHVLSIAVNDKGDNSVGVLDDFEGDVRPLGPKVDMGADEFTPLLFNAEFVSFMEPGPTACGDSAMPITVIIRNLGDTIFNMNINVNVTGDLVQSLPYVYSDTLLFSEYDTVTIGTINTYTGLNYNLLGYVDLLNEQDASNDTSALYPFMAIPYEPIGIDGVGCDGDTATIFGSTALPVTYQWYDSLVGGNLVATGNSYQIPSVTSQNTYYLQYASGVQDSLSTGFAGGNGSALNFFDVVAINTIPITGMDGNLDPGTHNIDIYYKVGTWVGFEANPGAWTLVGSSTGVVSNGNGVPTPLQVNFNGLTIPAGQTYAFVMVSSGSIDYTNGTTVGNVSASNADMQILEGAGAANPVFTNSGFFSPRNWNGQIHYGSLSCSTFRTPVSATLDTTAIASFTSVSNYNTVNFDASSTTHQDSISWDFGDGNTSTLTMPTNTYTVDSTYIICLTAYSDCGIDVVCDTMNICDSLGGSFTYSANGLITTFTDVTAGNPTVWFWDFGDGNTSNLQNPVHTYATNGSYLVTLVVQNYCGQFSVSNSNVMTVGIDDYNDNSIVSVFPNPSGGEFTLNLANYQSDNITISVYNQLGKIVYDRTLSKNEQSSNYDLDLSDNANGVYFLKLSSNKGVITKRLIIK